MNIYLSACYLPGNVLGTFIHNEAEQRLFCSLYSGARVGNCILCTKSSLLPVCANEVL